jgi:uncharacterized protein (TIGR04255 family)
MSAPEKVVYPNQPLVEVVFELRFPGEMAVECQRHVFWEKVRAEYPNILVPNVFAPPVKPGEYPAYPALQPYRFERLDKGAGIAVAMDRFALYVREYEGYRAFREEFLRVLGHFNECFSVSVISRAGWRYVNLIPFVRKDGVIPLSEYLTLGFKVPDMIPERFSNLGLVFESKTDDGTITTRLDSRKSSKDSSEALLLDFDFGCQGDRLSMSEVPDYMETAHRHTRNLFEALITDKYRTFLKGDVL